MEIKKLIKIFEKCLKNYQKGYDEKYSYKQLINNKLQRGICFNAYWENFGNTYILFDNKEYYNKLTDNLGYLFPYPKNYEELLPRINWLKEEIKDLNKLLKKGYTEV